MANLLFQYLGTFLCDLIMVCNNMEDEKEDKEVENKEEREG
jgi:4-hydroxybenzoate polyprenyltransferase